MSFAAEPVSDRWRAPLLSYGAAVLMVAAATAGAVVVDRAAQVPNLSLVFVLPVVLAAIRFGAGPALATAALGAGAYNFFLLAPRYTLRIADPANVLALVLLLIVAVAVSWVAAQARRRTLEAMQAAERAAAVRELARDLLAERDRDGIAKRCAEALAAIFRTRAVVLLADDDGLKTVGGVDLTEADLEAASWAAGAGLPTRGGTYPTADAAFDFWPLKTPLRRQAVVGVAISGGEAGRPAEPERLVETVLGYLGVALDREAYAAQALAGEVAVAHEQLKTDLLAAVSHDLRTPLSTVLFTLQSLRRFPNHDAGARDELLAGAETEAARLAGMVDNLLDMNRVEAGALSVRPQACDLADLAEAGLMRAAGVLSGREVTNGVGPGAVVLADPALFETALSNVLANAAKYAPEGPIELTAGADGHAAWIEVADRGPGFGGDAEPMFAKFARGQAGDGRAPGTGLGLALARSFLRAMGGEASARDREGGGAVVRLSAPLRRAGA